MSEYAPDLGVNLATVQMYDQQFTGTSGALFKQRVADAARVVGLNPGLLASSLLAEFGAASYTHTSGEVKGWDIGLDDFHAVEADIKAKVNGASSLKATRYTSEVNEQGRAIPKVPVFKAEDAVLASAAYLKYAELKVRDVFVAMGGSFDRLPVEEQFAFTRYTMNAGAGAMKKRAMELLGMKKQKDGTLVHKGHGKEFLQYKPGAINSKKAGGTERFNAHHPQRAATAHAAQAVHLSQRVFGIYPSGGSDSLMLPR